MHRFIRPGIKAISLDAWDTLLRGNSKVTRLRLRLIARMLGVKVTDNDVEALVESYRASALYYNLQSDLTGRDYGFRYRIGKMFELAGVSAPMTDGVLTVPDETIEAIQHAVSRLRSQPEYLPFLIEDDLLNTLASLRESRLKIAILSNSGADGPLVMVPILTELGIMKHIDLAIFSAEDGRTKPHPGLFRRLAEGLELGPNEILHIGDNSIADVQGARNVGMQSLLYAPRGNITSHIRALSHLLPERKVCVSTT